MYIQALTVEAEDVASPRPPEDRESKFGSMCATRKAGKSPPETRRDQHGRFRSHKRWIGFESGWVASRGNYLWPFRGHDFYSAKSAEGTDNRCADPDSRRERKRKGAARAIHSLPIGNVLGRVCKSELCRNPGSSSRERSEE